MSGSARQTALKEEVDAMMKENKGTVESDVKCFDGDVATEVVEEGAGLMEVRTVNHRN